MYTNFFRETAIGQAIRYASRGKLFAYPEESTDFNCPSCYNKGGSTSREKSREGSTPDSNATTPRASSPDVDPEKQNSNDLSTDRNNTLNRAPTQPDAEAPATATQANRSLSPIVSRSNMSRVGTRNDLEAAYSNASQQRTVSRAVSQPIEPQKTADGITLVDWYTTDDQDNPQNWSQKKKVWVIFQIYFYTLAVYIGSAIYTPSIPYVMEQTGVNAELASMGLSMYVFGYGLGPLFWSPLSEIPSVGRNIPYVATFTIYFLLCIPTALVNSFPALVVLRFLQGVFGSPCLATGGASVGDIFSLIEMPYWLTGWAGFATAGPALGPLVSGFSVPKTNWHWSLWEQLWFAAPVLVCLWAFLPETSGPTILYRRAQRLRKTTGRTDLMSQSEIDQSKLSVREIAVANLIRPFQINILDPAVLFTTVYVALMYGIYYSFFEVFPLVFQTGIDKPGSPTHGYGFNAGEEGLIFLTIAIGVLISIPIYCAYLYYIVNPGLMKNGLGEPEKRLIPGIFVSWMVPAGLFIFAWTSYNAPHYSWVVPCVGLVIFTVGVFILMQCLFIYIPLTYPQYAASLFAANDFARSSLAAGAIHFASPLYQNLGVGPGCSILAGITCGFVPGIIALYVFGKKLRSKSRFAVG